MLTQQDLQAIAKIIDAKLDERFGKQDQKIADRFTEYDRKMDSRFKRELAPIKAHLKKIDKNIESLLRMVRHDDNQIANLDKQVIRIEKHLRLSSNTL